MKRKNQNSKTRQKTVSKRSVKHAIHRHVRLSVVPHKANQYRPHLLRWQGLTIFLAFVVALQFAYYMSQRGFVLGQNSDVTTRQLLSETNAESAKQNLKPLEINAELSRAASAKAQDMLSNQYWSHTSPSGVEPWRWVEASGYEYSAAGENLAKNFQTTNGVINAWMNSDEHRENILNGSYKDVGFAVASGELNGQATMIVVALYGAPVSDQVSNLIPTVLAATTSKSLAARFRERLQNLNPVTIVSVVLLAILSLTALVAHAYRDKLPREWRTSWRRHHALYKSLSMAGLAVVLVIFYGSGQI